MFIIKGNERKIEKVWEHIKRQHTGDKIAVVGFQKKMPQTHLRNKQVIFYESLTDEKKWLQQADEFLARFEEQYDGIIFYVDCALEEAKALGKIALKYRSKVTVTVLTDEANTVESLPLKRAA